MIPGRLECPIIRDCDFDVCVSGHSTSPNCVCNHLGNGELIISAAFAASIAIHLQCIVRFAGRETAVPQAAGVPPSGSGTTGLTGR